MKKIFFVMMTLLMSASMIMAQGRGPKDGKQENVDPKVRAERMTERMAKDLSLNDTQKAELLKLNLAEVEKRAECKANPQTPPSEGENPAKLTDEQRQQMRAEREAQRTAYNAQLQKILTPEQFTKYTEQEKNRDNKDKKGKDGKKGGDRKSKKSNS